VNADERVFRQIQNILNFTKTSNSHYSAEQFPAAYHTINVNGRQVPGQRDPSKRLASVPVDFHGQTVLDLGCNQGGMLHQIRSLIKWGVGIDYDPRMINAANRIKSVNASENIGFYVLDLQNDPLELICDFMPDQKADICFLLSVCMWLKNWQQVIDFAHSKSNSMLFETNGSALQQNEQINYLRAKYSVVNMLSGISDDDPIQKFRKLFYLTGPI
jgi:SAM-dependent methyltransferase